MPLSLFYQGDTGYAKALVTIFSSLNLTIMKRTSLFAIHALFLLLASGWLPSPAMAGRSTRPPSPDSTGTEDPTAHSPKAHGRENDGSLAGCCEKLMTAKRSIYYLNDWSYKMAFQLRAIYTREETMFFCLGLHNHSHINYSIDSIRFYIADERRSGNAPVRGTRLIPLCAYGNTKIIRGKSKEFCVIALPGFTLPAKKLLVIDVSEKNGGRHLQLLASNYTLIRARLI
jgi:hypothetical protein